MPGRLVVPEFVIGEPTSRLDITCPRCNNSFVVNLPEWLASMPGYQTRVCTYCFKVGKIPDEIWRMTW